MTNIIDQITTGIKQARLQGNKDLLDNLVLLKHNIMYGLSQKQPVKPQKTIANLITSYKETQAWLRDPEVRKKYQRKIEFLEAFLQSQEQLDTNALQQLLVDNDFTSIREWMSFLKTNYPDQYDGRLASTLYNDK